jgi:hypothetical protein
VKPFRGKRRGPQSPSVGFSLTAVRRVRRDIREESATGAFERAASGALPACGAPRPVCRRSEAPAGGDRALTGPVLQPRMGVDPSADRGRLHRGRRRPPASRSSRPVGTVVSARLPWTFGDVGRSAPTWGQWRIGRSPVRPVLKHGPRSLTCARVSGCYET